MHHSGFRGAVGVALLVALSCCGGSRHSADSPASDAMTPNQARAFIAQVEQERGLAIDRTPVTGMDQLLQALADDQIGRFSSAEQLVAGKPGIEALALNATIELVWSDDFTTFARILDELKRNADFALKQLNTQRESGRVLTEAEAKALEQHQKNAEFAGKAKVALQVLAEEHLHSARTVAYQALRQFPKDPITYRVAAYLSLLSREWPDFDSAMSWFPDTEAKDAGLVYLRGLEALNRRRIPKDAIALFQEALRLNPKMVRAQVKLVLAADGAEARYAEFERLRAVAPLHPMVAIWGPSIISDHELSSSFRDALAARQPPAVVGTGAQPAASGDQPRSESNPANGPNAPNAPQPDAQ